MNQLQKIIAKRNELVKELEKLEVGTKFRVIEKFYEHVELDDVLEVVDKDDLSSDSLPIQVIIKRNNDGFWLNYNDLEFIEIIEE